MTARVLTLAASIVAAGCSVATAGRVGPSLDLEGGVREQHGWEVRGALRPQSGFHGYGAWEIDGRSVRGEGALWTIGGSAGVILVPASRPGAIGFLAHADVGVPLGWDPNASGWYLGATVGMPISLARDRLAADMNRNYQLVAMRPSLVPFLRFRSYGIRAGNVGDADWAIDLSFGVQMELLLATELL